MIRIPPYHYIHVLDQTTNVTRLEVGPATFVRKDNEMLVSGEKYLILFNSDMNPCTSVPTFSRMISRVES